MPLEQADFFEGIVILRVCLDDFMEIRKCFLILFLFIVKTGTIGISKKVCRIKRDGFCPSFFSLIIFSLITFVCTEIHVEIVIGIILLDCLFYIFCGT